VAQVRAGEEGVEGHNSPDFFPSNNHLEDNDCPWEGKGDLEYLREANNTVYRSTKTLSFCSLIPGLRNWRQRKGGC